MSRSWERMVERNTKQLNKRRKKEGKPAISSQRQGDKFLGRSYIFPALLIMLMLFYGLMFGPWNPEFEQNETVYWVTVVCYVLLAAMYFFRRPYLTVTRDSLETRKFTGYKTLRPSGIRKIVLGPNYVVIEPVKGSNWVFSRWINLFPIDKMAERLKLYAQQNQVDLEVRNK